MKNFVIILILIFTSLSVQALTVQDVIENFDKYTQYANSYDAKLLDMYSPNVKIIREVITSTGQVESVEISTERFFKELKIGQKTARLRRYKNKYKNVVAKEIPNGFKVSAQRQPSRETYWLQMYQIWQETDSGLKITEEMMQTKVQSFLRHKRKGKK